MPGSSSTMRMLCMLRTGGRCDGFRRQRQLDDEPCAHGLVFFNANRTMVIFNNPAYDRQAKPSAPSFRREVRQKESLFQFLSDPVPCIGDGELDRVAAGDQ